MGWAAPHASLPAPHRAAGGRHRGRPHGAERQRGVLSAAGAPPPPPRTDGQVGPGVRGARGWGQRCVPPQCQPPSPPPHRLLRQLAEKEREWQRLAQRALCSGDATLPHLPPPRGEEGDAGGSAAVGQGPSAPRPERSPAARADPLLVEWLRQRGTDPTTTATVRPTAARSPAGLSPTDAVGRRLLTAASAAPDPRLHPAGPAGRRHPRRPLLHRDEVPARGGEGDDVG